MPNSEGFWSYVHKDDQADGGRIVQLAHDLTAQYEVITGQTINLFLDRDSLDWGDNWRENIDRSLTTAAFFVAILTPRYFMSSECRRELQTFTREARRLGFKDLILPLLYVDIPDFGDETNPDEAQKLFKKFQWVDWRKLRFEERNSSAYRAAVAGLAQRIVKAHSEIVYKVPGETSAVSVEHDGSTSDKGPGFAQLRAAIDDTMDAAVGIMKGFTAELDNFSDLFTKGVDSIQPSTHPGEKAAILERTARDLTPSANRMLEFSNKHSMQMYAVDTAVRTFILRAPDEIQRDVGRRLLVCAVFASITNAARSSRNLVDQLREGTRIADRDSMPRQLWPVFQIMKLSATIMAESVLVAEEWMKAVQDSPVECVSTKSLTVD